MDANADQRAKLLGRLFSAVLSWPEPPNERHSARPVEQSAAAVNDGERYDLDEQKAGAERDNG